MPYNALSDTSEFQAAAVASVVAEVALLRKALLGSERMLIEECVPRLTQAAATLQEAFQELEHPLRRRSALRRDLAVLRRDLAVAAGLAQSGAVLYQGLARLLGAAAGGYTSQGDGAPLPTSVSVLVRG